MVGLERSLDASLSLQLISDGFCQIGRFSISDVQTHRSFEYEIDRPDADKWRYSIYAYVSLNSGGTVVRIGKCEQALRVRLKSYVYYVGGAVKNKVGLNEQYKGGTPPWERDGWLAHLASGHGLIFAQTLDEGNDDGKAKKLLIIRERALITKYDPPLCNDSLSGKKLKREWIEQHGKPIIRRRREVG